jgi:hypothetical protein
MTKVKEVSIKNSGRKILTSATIFENDQMSEIVALIKDEDVDEYYLKYVTSGWEQISEIQKNWTVLTEYNYYVDKTVVPLIYYILSTNPESLKNIFEFLYENNFIAYEEDEQE